MKTPFRSFLAAVAVLVLFLAAGIPQGRATNAPESSILVLVDLSASYFEGPNDRRMASNLSKISSAVQTLGKRLDQPVEIYMLSIADISLSAPALCNGVYKKSLFPRREPGLMTSDENLRDFLSVCSDRILATQPTGNTDIAGALNLAGRVVQSEPDDERVLILLSDMHDDPLGTHNSGRFDVEGFRIALIYSVSREAAMSPEQQVDQRLESWEQRLIEAGATDVFTMIDQRNYAATLARDLSR